MDLSKFFAEWPSRLYHLFCNLESRKYSDGIIWKSSTWHLSSTRFCNDAYIRISSSWNITWPFSALSCNPQFIQQRRLIARRARESKIQFLNERDHCALRREHARRTLSIFISIILRLWDIDLKPFDIYRKILASHFNPSLHHDQIIKVFQIMLTIDKQKEEEQEVQFKILLLRRRFLPSDLLISFQFPAALSSTIST